MQLVSASFEKFTSTRFILPFLMLFNAEQAFEKSIDFPSYTTGIFGLQKNPVASPSELFSSLIPFSIFPISPVLMFATLLGTGLAGSAGFSSSWFVGGIIGGPTG